MCRIPQSDLKQVMEAHAGRLMAIPGVVGVALGELDDGTPCIQILVARLTAALRRKLPTRLEGHPVALVESGPIRPL